MLKKFIFILIFLFYTISSKPAFADLNTLKAEYSQRLLDQSQALSEYKVAKNTYETYGTLSSLTQVLLKSKIYLEKQDNLLIKHFELLNTKIDEMDFKNDEKKNTLKQIIQEEINFFQNHLLLIQSISTIDDINTNAKTSASEIEKANWKSKQILGNILIAKVNLQKITYEEKENKLINFINDLKNNSKLTPAKIEKLERWLVEVKNKKIIAENNILQNLIELDKLGKSNKQQIDKKFDTVRISIIQGSLYLKEGTNFMKEILNEIQYE